MNTINAYEVPKTAPLFIPNLSIFNYVHLPDPDFPHYTSFLPTSFTISMVVAIWCGVSEARRRTIHVEEYVLPDPMGTQLFMRAPANMVLCSFQSVHPFGEVHIYQTLFQQLKLKIDTGFDSAPYRAGGHLQLDLFHNAEHDIV